MADRADNTCFKCGRPGHFARDCRSGGPPGQRTFSRGGFGYRGRGGFRGGRGGGSNACYRCGEVGHFARECTQPPADGEVGGQNGARGGYSRPPRSTACYECGQEGHIARNCPNRRPGETGGPGGERPKRDIVCYKCNEPGHIARDCTRA